ncbi:HlyD_D23 family protein YbhG [Rhodovastum atsumiense]|uniref:efflux RND transporter periplasmic adaptor subunit n=1 Tax=Rhodovastum atsumiense TaxID=504468 RepID=UPI00139F2A64|nr:HlyD family efflux transporter periplasmic adaptor subunit [Rhodovastum atsumiense]CAH2603785.1 HlyD_D23 family protein YbhG [Rhodovastum atsumiense]
MRPKRLAVLLVALAVMAGVVWLVVQRAGSAPPPGTLFGNVEIRQVDLAFNTEGRVVSMARREGEAVRLGEVVAELDDETYRSLRDLAVARRDAARANLGLLLAGTRIEQLDQARASVATAQANLAHAEAVFARQEELVRRDVSSRQAYDDARMALDAGRAQLDHAKAVLAEAVAGPRAGEIEAARATLRESEAAVALAAEALSRTRLKAPADGVVMTRVIEPGTVVLPSAPVYSMAISGEVWVRAFVPEPLLGRAAPGREVQVRTDGGRVYAGRVGYLSPVAEFTPKTVETPELRTQLVYRLRIRITAPDDGLRQGMPVTISLGGE